MAYIYDPAIAARKKKNAAIFRETTKFIKDGGYVTPSGRRMPIDYTRMDEAEFESK